MNVEQLLLISSAVIEDIERTKIVQRLQELLDAFNNHINSPNEQTSQQVSQARTAVIKAIDSSEFDNLPKTWRSGLEEMGIENMLGGYLKSEISLLIEKNQITPTDARDGIARLRKKIDNFKTHADNLIKALNFVGITSEELEPNEAELSVLIPRLAINNNLKDLSFNLKLIDRDICFFFRGSRRG